MLPLEHSTILLTCIKRLLVGKPIFGLFKSGSFTPVLLYYKKTIILTAINIHLAQSVVIGYELKARL